MPITLRRVIAPVFIIAIPGTGPGVDKHHIGAQSAIKVRGKDGGLDPGTRRGVIVISPQIVIVDAHGRVIEVVVTPRPVVGEIVRGSDPATIESDDSRQASHGQEKTSDRHLDHWVISFLTSRWNIPSDTLSIWSGSPYCQDVAHKSLFRTQFNY